MAINTFTYPDFYLTYYSPSSFNGGPLAPRPIFTNRPSRHPSAPLGHYYHYYTNGDGTPFIPGTPDDPAFYVGMQPMPVSLGLFYFSRAVGPTSSYNENWPTFAPWPLVKNFKATSRLLPLSDLYWLGGPRYRHRANYGNYTGHHAFRISFTVEFPGYSISENTFVNDYIAAIEEAERGVYDGEFPNQEVVFDMTKMGLGLNCPGWPMEFKLDRFRGVITVNGVPNFIDNYDYYDHASYYRSYGPTRTAARALYGRGTGYPAGFTFQNPNNPLQTFTLPNPGDGYTHWNVDKYVNLGFAQFDTDYSIVIQGVFNPLPTPTWNLFSFPSSVLFGFCWGSWPDQAWGPNSARDSFVSNFSFQDEESFDWDKDFALSSPSREYEAFANGGEWLNQWGGSGGGGFS